MYAHFRLSLHSLVLQRTSRIEAATLGVKKLS
jgi:hypothetical protein